MRPHDALAVVEQVGVAELAAEGEALVGLQHTRGRDHGVGRGHRGNDVLAPRSREAGAGLGDQVLMTFS